MSEKAPTSTLLRSTVEVGLDRTKDIPTREPAQPPDFDPTTLPEQDPTDQLDAIDAQPNAEVLYGDAEILGKHYAVRQVVHEVGNQRMKVIEAVQARWKNTLDTPKKVRLGFVKSLAESRYNRHNAKRDEIQKLDDGLRKRRKLAKLAKVERKFNTAKQAYDGRKDQMKQRVTAVGEHATQRRDKSTAELKSRREAVLAKRAIKHEAYSQGASWLEAQRIIKDVPKEHLDRVAKLAGIAALSEKHATTATKLEEKDAYQESRTNKSIDKNRKRSTMYAGEEKKADETLTKMRDVSLPVAEKHFEDISAELDQLAEDDPARAGLMAQVNEAKQQITMYTEREIPYWEHIAEDSRNHMVALTAEHIALQEELRKHKKTLARHSEKADEKRAVAGQHTTARTAAINEITFEQKTKE